MTEWKECLLGDLITFQRGHDLPKSKMSGNGYPVVGSNGIIGFHNGGKKWKCRQALHSLWEVLVT